MSNRDPWVVVSGASGALGSVLARHYAEKGRRVISLDQRFDGIASSSSLERIVVRPIDLLAEQEVRQALDELVGDKQRISLLVNAVGRIWNEPILAFRGAKLVVHASDSWRSVIEANLTAPFVMA